MDEHTEYFIEKIADANFKFGEITQKEFFASFLLKQSSKYFEDGKDDLANIFRSLSINLNNESKEDRKQYNEQWVKIRNNAWEILDHHIGNIVYPENLEFNCE